MFVGFPESVISARRRIGAHIIRTPVRRLHWLEPFVGAPVYAKLDLQQHTGAFKFRGAINRILANRDQRKFVASSAGNHGIAVALAASICGAQANICVPVTASVAKKERIVRLGAGLIEQGTSVEEATSLAIKLADENQWTFISPFNDPHVIAGQGTLWLELLEEIPSISNIISPVGGGGLLSSAILAGHELGRTLTFFGCEPTVYASMSTSLQRGAITNVPRRHTLADGLAANLEAGSITFEIVRQQIQKMSMLQEEDIAAGMLACLVHESLLVEGAGAASIMACVRLAREKQLSGPVGLTLCGGNLHHSTLARVIAYPYSDEICLRLIERRGASLEQVRPRRVYGVSERQPHSTVEGSLEEDFEFFFGGVRERLCFARTKLDEFETVCREDELSISEPALHSTRTLIRESESLVGTGLAALRAVDDAGNSTWADRLTATELTLRAAMQAVATAENMLNWRSPTYAQSVAPQFFHLGTQGSGDVNYERYGHNEVRRVERQLLTALGLRQDRYACTVVSSGMAAYSLIEQYLMRYSFEPNAACLAAPYIYFENDEQLRSLPGTQITRAPGFDVAAIGRSIQIGAPQAVFADPLTNTVEQRLIDIPGLLHGYSTRKDAPTFVIDGSMVPFACAEALAAFEPAHKVFYFESCSKYLQFGLDLSMAGMIIHAVELKPVMERLRRNTGSILSEAGAALFPVYDRTRLMNRICRMERNASALAAELAGRATITNVVDVIHPSLANHPDAGLAARWGRSGAILTFKLRSDAEGSKDVLDSFVELLLHAARASHTPISNGVSFGFSFSRACAASAMAENTPPFLRLAVGDHPESITRAIADAFESAARALTTLGLWTNKGGGSCLTVRTPVINL